MSTATVPMCAVVHFEMPYKDRERAERFYAAAFGWTHQFLGPQMGDYVLVNTAPAGARPPMPPEADNTATPSPCRRRLMAPWPWACPALRAASSWPLTAPPSPALTPNCRIRCGMPPPKAGTACWVRPCPRRVRPACLCR